MSDVGTSHAGPGGAQAAAVRWFEQAVLLGNVSIAGEVFTPDVVMHSVAGEFVGLDALKNSALELRALDGLEGQLEIAGDGELLVATFVLRGRHARAFWSADPTGQLLEIHGTVTMRSEGSRLAELWKTCTVRHLDEQARTQVMEGEKPWARRWGLTLRESLVAELAMYGHADKEIAARLKLATGSVSKYLRSVMRKAGVGSRTALAERAGVVRLG